MQETNRLENFPISFFAMVMGLAGLTIAWEKMQHVLEIDLRINAGLVAVTATVFVVLTVLYAAKLVRYRNAVIKELKHPIKLNFFPAISTSMLLLSIAMMSLSPSVSHTLWLAGTALHLVITLYAANSMALRGCSISLASSLPFCSSPSWAASPSCVSAVRRNKICGPEG